MTIELGIPRRVASTIAAAALVAAFVPAGAAPAGASPPQIELYNQTFTGAELDAQVTAGNASYPAADLSAVNGSTLELSPSEYGGDAAVVLFRMPVLPIGSLTGLEDLVVTVTIDWVALTGDNDFGIAISDGTRAVGGMQGDQPRSWSLDSPDGGTLLTGEDYSPAAILDTRRPVTYVISAANQVGPSSVQATNANSGSVNHQGLSAIDYGKSIDFLLVGNNGFERYGVKSVTIRAEATSGNADPDLAADSASVSTDEGTDATNSGTVSDPDGDSVTLTASTGSVVDNNDGTWSWSNPGPDGPDGYNVTIGADDGNGGSASTEFSVTVENVAPTVTGIVVPAPTALFDQPITVNATFTDPAGIDDEPYSCTVDHGDGTGDVAGTVTGTTCTGPAHTFAEPGTYTVSVTVTDDDGASGGATATAAIVIWDKGDCKKGGWAGLTDDEGTPFKNQGDCVSYFATGGRNKADG